MSSRASSMARAGLNLPPSVQACCICMSRRLNVPTPPQICGRRLGFQITTVWLLSRYASRVLKMSRLKHKTFTSSLCQIDKELIHWPNFMIHKCKQRVTKITQYLIKMRRLALRQQCVPCLLPPSCFLSFPSPAAHDNTYHLHTDQNLLA